MTGISLHPHAKVNLGLLIKGKRPDGYHLLETLLYPVYSLADRLEIVPITGESPQLSLSGIQVDGPVDENLCIKAWKALKKEVPSLPSVHIKLEKHIPAGAGLGGGSSDAAHTLKGLNELFELGWTADQLAPIAAQLGADVPFFLYDSPMIASGIGTELVPYTVTQRFELRVYPQPFHSSTVAAYKALHYQDFDPNRDLKALLDLPLSAWGDQLPNDLEVPVFGLYPQLAGVKADLYAQGAVYAAMSGSGSAMLALFGS